MAGSRDRRFIGMRESAYNAMYTQFAKRGQLAQNTLAYLIRERGAAKIDASGDLEFGSWVVRGDHSVVDEVRKMTGADATIFQLRDGIPMRATTTVRKIGRTERDDGSAMVGPQLLAVTHGLTFVGVKKTADGREYIGHSELIKDSSGTIIGVLTTGVPESDAAE